MTEPPTYTIVEASIYKATWRDIQTGHTNTTYVAHTNTLLDLPAVASQLHNLHNNTLISLKELQPGYIVTQEDWLSTYYKPISPRRPPIQPTGKICSISPPRPPVRSTDTLTIIKQVIAS